MIFPKIIVDENMPKDLVLITTDGMENLRRVFADMADKIKHIEVPPSDKFLGIGKTFALMSMGNLPSTVKDIISIQKEREEAAARDKRFAELMHFKAELIFGELLRDKYIPGPRFPVFQQSWHELRPLRVSKKPHKSLKTTLFYRLYLKKK